MAPGTPQNTASKKRLNSLDYHLSCTFCLSIAMACLPKIMILLPGDLIPWSLAHLDKCD